MRASEIEIENDDTATANEDTHEASIQTPSADVDADTARPTPRATYFPARRATLGRAIQNGSRRRRRARSAIRIPRPAIARPVAVGAVHR